MAFINFTPVNVPELGGSSPFANDTYTNSFNHALYGTVSPFERIDDYIRKLQIELEQIFDETNINDDIIKQAISDILAALTVISAHLDTHDMDIVQLRNDLSNLTNIFSTLNDRFNDFEIEVNSKFDDIDVSITNLDVRLNAINQILTSIFTSLSQIQNKMMLFAGKFDLQSDLPSAGGVAQGIMYFVENDLKLYTSLDTNWAESVEVITGSPFSSVSELPPATGAQYAVVGDSVYGTIITLDEDGNVVWEWDTTNPVFNLDGTVANFSDLPPIAPSSGTFALVKAEFRSTAANVPSITGQRQGDRLIVTTTSAQYTAGDYEYINNMWVHAIGGFGYQDYVFDGINWNKNQTDNTPLASENQHGYMPKESFAQVIDLTSRVETLETGVIPVRISFTDIFSTATPTDAQIKTYLSGLTPPITDYNDVRLTNTDTTDVWVVNTSTDAFVNVGSDTVQQWTNSAPGKVKGSTTEGQIFAENNGTGSVIGWADLKGNVSSLQSNVSSLTSGKEDKSNKVISISSSSTDTQYPSAKAVNTLVSSILATGKENYYGTCATAAGTVAKTTSIAGFTAANLVAGTQVFVRFTNQNSAVAPTLNVSSTGAKEIRIHGNALTAGTAYLLRNNIDINLFYDGTYWEIVNESETFVQTDIGQTITGIKRYGNSATLEDISIKAPFGINSGNLYIDPFVHNPNLNAASGASNNAALGIQSGGLVVVGGGESPSNFLNAIHNGTIPARLQQSISAGSEYLIMTTDSNRAYIGVGYQAGGDTGNWWEIGQASIFNPTGDALNVGRQYSRVLYPGIPETSVKNTEILSEIMTIQNTTNHNELYDVQCRCSFMGQGDYVIDLGVHVDGAAARNIHGVTGNMPTGHRVNNEIHYLVPVSANSSKTVQFYVHNVGSGNCWASTGQIGVVRLC